jgi:Tfp pilus assembly protein PilO
MDFGMDKAKLAQSKAQIVKLLGDPVKMRLAVIVSVMALAIGAVYYPLSGQITEQRVTLEAEKARLETIHDVETLRRDAKEYRTRVDAQSDTNEWVQYLLAGSRQVGIRLRGMETKEPHKVGPYMAVALTVEVQGTYPQLQNFIAWLDTSDRLLRVETLRFEKMPGVILMKISILGLVQKHA